MKGNKIKIIEFAIIQLYSINCNIGIKINIYIYELILIILNYKIIENSDFEIFNIKD